MRSYYLAAATALIFCSTNCHAQAPDPADVILGYNDLSNPTELLIAAMDGFTATSVPYFEDVFGVPDPFLPDDFGTNDPGFITNAGLNLLVNEDDQIFANVLDASQNPLWGGVGYVNFYNPAEDAIEGSGRLAFRSNSSAAPSLTLNGGEIESGDTSRFVDFGRFSVANSSGFGLHRHLLIDLLDDATALPGAYGVLVELQSDFGPSPDGEVDLTSEPFWIIWNHQMSNADFQNLALPAFINAGSSVVLGDFDQDGDVDLADLDRYIGNLGMDAIGDLQALDLNANGVVDSEDFQQHYEQLVETSNGGKGTFAGDINLDGTVNVLGDAFALVGNLGSQVTSWSNGDLNGDATVNVLGDAFLLVANLGNSNAN